MDIKTLLKESVSEEVSSQIQQGLTEAISLAVAEKNLEIELLKESAQKYGDNVKSEVTEKLSEKAEEYGNYLIEQAEDYATHLKEEFAEKEADYVQQIADLKEKANEYGEYIKQELIEKADQYTEQFISEYQSKNTAMFESIKSEQSAVDILETFKATLAMFGNTNDSVISELKESLEMARNEIKDLKQSLYESDVSKQKEAIIDELTESLSYNEKQTILNASKDILTENLDSFKNIVSILVSRKTQQVNETRKDLQEKINENVNNTNSNKNVFDSIKNTNSDTSFRLI